MKPPTLRSQAARNRIIRFYAIFSAIMYKIIPVIVLALVFAQIAVLLDQGNYRRAPATDFLQYTDFTVQNARVGEDVYFKVCRQHTSNIRYQGNLNVYIITSSDQKTEQRIKVYGREIKGTIDNDCENKVVRATTFRHEAGTYEMSFCVEFNVKYGYQKELCKTSNRYRIYPQPADLESQIMDLQARLEAAQAQLKDTQGTTATPSAKPRLAVPQNTTPGPNNQSTPGSTGSTDRGGQTGTGVQPPTCAVSLGGLGLACGSDGILRL